ncbi:MAG: DUF4105 domain-containing protein [Dokdonella sp.]
MLTPSKSHLVLPGRARLLGLLASLCMLLVLGSAFANPSASAVDSDKGISISLLTVGAGEIYWERFGHNAIVVRDAATGSAISYNYGIFDFEEADFFLNFLRGHMRYRIAANTLQDDVAMYAAEQRWVVEQELAFTPAQARALKDFLEWNLRPENAFYRYDYYLANCSTKVRDALDEALGGILHAQLSSPSRGYTFRLLTDALMSPEPMLMVAMDAGLGPFADRRLSFWDDSFVPMQLMDHLRGVQIQHADGSSGPLVLGETLLAPMLLREPPAAALDLRWVFFPLGAILGFGLLGLFAQRDRTWARRSFAGIAFGLSLIAGVAGLILAGLWVFTEHRAAWRNENLLLLSPLCLLLLPTWWRSARLHWAPSRQATGLAMLIALGASCALFVKILRAFPQENLPWIGLWLPVHLALLWVMYRHISDQTKN